MRHVRQDSISHWLVRVDALLALWVHLQQEDTRIVPPARLASTPRVPDQAAVPISMRVASVQREHRQPVQVTVAPARTHRQGRQRVLRVQPDISQARVQMDVTPVPLDSTVRPLDREIVLLFQRVVSVARVQHPHALNYVRPEHFPLPELLGAPAVQRGSIAASMGLGAALL